MARFLVTGGAGFIGSHVVESLLQLGGQVSVLDDLSTGFSVNLPKRATFLHGDVLDEEVVDRAVAGVDYVLHLAAFTSVPLSVERPKDCIRINSLGFLNVLESARRHGVKKVVYSSTSAVYPDYLEGPATEQIRPQPGSPYGVTKLEGEYLLEIYRREAGLDYVALRYFNVYGPRQRPESSYASVIPSFLRCLQHDRDLVVDGDGLQTRDFVFVTDVAAANLTAIQRGTGVYNVGAGCETSILHLARLTLDLTRTARRIQFGPPRPGDARRSVADVSRITTDLGWKPTVALQDGLMQAFSWFRQQAF